MLKKKCSGISLVCWAFSALLLLVLWASPTADAQIFGKFGIKEEAELGRKFSALIRSQLPIVDDNEIVDYVEDIVERIHKEVPPMPFPVKTSVVANGALNAFAAPAGHVFVFTGLIHHVDHEAEVAGVIAHELAHVSQRHIAARIEQLQKVQIGALAGMLAGLFLGGGDAGSAVLFGSQAMAQSAVLNYSRENEREADQVGMNYFLAAGYPPEGMVGAFKKLRRMAWLGGGSLPPWLSTHPGVEERIDYLGDRIKRLPPEVRERKHDDTRFFRIRNIVRAKYFPAETSLSFFPEKNDADCMNIMGRAVALDRLNRKKEAEAVFEKALACGPMDSVVQREAGRFYFKNGKQSKAAMHLQKAALINPNDLTALFFYARLLDEAKDFKNSALYYERILRALPDHAEVHYHYGRMKGRSGDHFTGHLHLAYAALFSNDLNKARYHLGSAEKALKSIEDRRLLQEFNRYMSERAALLKP
jgi:predicted Zn-dependent protease